MALALRLPFLQPLPYPIRERIRNRLVNLQRCLRVRNRLLPLAEFVQRKRQVPQRIAFPAPVADLTD